MDIGQAGLLCIDCHIMRQTATIGNIRIDDDLYDLSSVEAEFPAIVVNDEFAPQNTLQYKSQEEQNVLYFNDLFPFNIIRPDDLKSEKDNDDNDIDIIQPFENNEITHGSTMLFETSHDEITKSLRMGSFAMKLNVKIMIWKYYVNGMLYYLIKNLCAPFGVPFDPKRYYKDGDCAIMLWRPRYGSSTAIHRREVHRVPIFDFRGLPDLMAWGLTARMLMEHWDDQGIILDLDTLGTLQFQLGGARRRMSWREFILALGLHTDVEMQTAGFAPSYIAIWDPIHRLCHRLIACSITGRSQAPKKVTVTDFFYLRGMDVGSVNVPYLLARYLRLYAAGRKSGDHISGGQFVTRLAEHFGLLTAEILGGLTAWVAMRPERQPDAAAGAPADAEDAPIVDEGDQAVLAPVQAPQQPPPPSSAPARTMPQRMDRLEEDVQEIRGALTEQREVIDAVAHDFFRFSTWAITGLGWMINRAGVTYTPYSQTHVSFQRRTRQRTNGASTSAAQ
ncbi:hypothetical protein Tco_0818513 [Tanacetum coccineum]